MGRESKTQGIYMCVWLVQSGVQQKPHNVVKELQYWYHLLSCVRSFGTPQTVAHQAPLSMGFSKQEHWSGLPFPPLGDLPDPGIGRWVLYYQCHLGSPKILLLKKKITTAFSSIT